MNYKEKTFMHYVSRFVYDYILYDYIVVYVAY